MSFCRWGGVWSEDLVGGFRKKDGWLVTSGRKDKEKDECPMTTVGHDGGEEGGFSRLWLGNEIDVEAVFFGFD